MISTIRRWVRAHPFDVLVYTTLAFLACVYVAQEVYGCDL